MAATGLSSTAFTCVLIASVCAATAGCGDSPTAPSNNAPFSQSDLRVGTGAEAVTGGFVTVRYTGWFYNASEADQKGPEFGSSLDGPFSFTLGAGDVISGWDRGIPGMRVGGVRRLIVPPSLAYGPVRNGPIPPNATLLYEIELLDVE